MDISKLTMGEIALVESLSGLSLEEVGADQKPKGLALAALAFVAKKRADAEFTWNDAQALTYTEVNEILGDGEADDATEAVPGAETPTDPKGSRAKS